MCQVRKAFVALSAVIPEHGLECHLFDKKRNEVEQVECMRAYEIWIVVRENGSLDLTIKSTHWWFDRKFVSYTTTTMDSDILRAIDRASPYQLSLIVAALTTPQIESLCRLRPSLFSVNPDQLAVLHKPYETPSNLPVVPR